MLICGKYGIQNFLYDIYDKKKKNKIYFVKI